MVVLVPFPPFLSSVLLFISSSSILDKATKIKYLLSILQTLDMFKDHLLLNMVLTSSLFEETTLVGSLILIISSFFWTLQIVKSLFISKCIIVSSDLL
ncbi:hypothetical protein C1646_720149 [Rhizophagus diaphanus]|nr:hypothetical protein C1646_720149 [Rhizophagus diaphanus] [Rhizophagus sp. MUCL 43196]